MPRVRLALAIVGSAFIGLAELLLTIFLTEIFGWHHELSYGVSLTVGLLILYEYHRIVTFGVARRTPKQFFGFFGNYGLSYAANWFLTSALSRLLPYWLAIIVVNAALFFVNYWINKKWVFVKERSVVLPPRIAGVSRKLRRPRRRS